MDLDWNCLLGKFQPSQLVCKVRAKAIQKTKNYVNEIKMT